MIFFRAAEDRDLSEICRLGNLVNQLHFKALPHLFAETVDSAKSNEAHWRSSAFSEGAIAIVAEYRQAVIGFITFVLVDETNTLLQPVRFARIGTIGVDESMRGRGIGTELMRRAERTAREKGAVEIRLNVFAFNRHAITLYEDLGYEARSQSMAKSI